MNTNGVKYIGSKDKLIEHILNAISNIAFKEMSIIDVFTGTTRVAQALKKSGFMVQTSDLNWASECYSDTFICNKRNNEHLQWYIDELNAIEGQEDWLTSNYSDVIADGNVVRVWQRKNTLKADAIRNKIEKYNLDKWEKNTLITSLIFALDKVDNTVGVQQAYLKDWCARSFNDLKLVLPENIEGITGKHYCGNCLEIEYDRASIAYLDPPYSPHSYATYYHIWDSIARWDKPEVSLKTNRRADRTGTSTEMKSLWNSKKTAISATRDLIERLPVEYIVMSYNNEGIISPEDLFSIINEHDDVSVLEVDYKRNIMSKIGNATLYKESFSTENKEYIISFKK